MFWCYRDELSRMRKPADVLSAEEVAALRHKAEADLEDKRAVSKARKEHMLKVIHLTEASLLCVSQMCMVLSDLHGAVHTLTNNIGARLHLEDMLQSWGKA